MPSRRPASASSATDHLPTPDIPSALVTKPALIALVRLTALAVAAQCVASLIAALSTKDEDE